MKRKFISVLLLAGIVAATSACSSQPGTAVQQENPPVVEQTEGQTGSAELQAELSQPAQTPVLPEGGEQTEDGIWTGGLTAYSDFKGVVDTYKDPEGRFSMNYEPDYFSVQEDGHSMDVRFDYTGKSDKKIFVAVKYIEDQSPSSIKAEMMEEYDLHKGEFSSVDFGAQSIPALSVNIPNEKEKGVTAYSLLDLNGDTLMVAVNSYPNAPDETGGHIEYLLGTLEIV